MIKGNMVITNYQKAENNSGAQGKESTSFVEHSMLPDFRKLIITVSGNTGGQDSDP